MPLSKHNAHFFRQGKAKWEAFAAAYTGPYDLSLGTYQGMNHKFAFVCPTHGLRAMDAKYLMQGRQCVMCVFEARRGRGRITQGKMLARFAETHGTRYDYAQALYETQRSPIKIGCVRHGVFLQAPEDHWNGSGCPLCFHEDRRGASQRDTLESFVAKATAQYGNLFDFSGVVYVNSQTEITIRCTKHNQVCTPRPNWLLNGCNPCTRCNHTASKEEFAVYRFVSTFVDAVHREKGLIRPKEIDVYVPSSRLGIEYCGMWYHSGKTKEETLEIKNRHVDKYRICRDQGIRLITLYESEWMEHRYAVKRLIRNALGKTRGKLMARKCALRQVAHAEARAFYDRYHPQGGEGSGEHYGLYWKDKLVACMRFTFGANDRGGAERVWTLTRYATRVTVAGGASRLFKAFLTDRQPTEVKSFSDNRFFEGGMYQALGFRLEEELDPDYMVWSPKIGLRPKSHYQRRLLPKRLQEHGLNEVFDPETDPRSEADMTYLMGCGRIHDCGKKRWVWSLDTPPNP
jgi:hypothetical protein